MRKSPDSHNCHRPARRQRSAKHICCFSSKTWIQLIRHSHEHASTLNGWNPYQCLKRTTEVAFCFCWTCRLFELVFHFISVEIASFWRGWKSKSQQWKWQWNATFKTPSRVATTPHVYNRTVPGNLHVRWLETYVTRNTVIVPHNYHIAQVSKWIPCVHLKTALFPVTETRIFCV